MLGALHLLRVEVAEYLAGWLLSSVHYGGLPKGPDVPALDVAAMTVEPVGNVLVGE